MSRRELSPFWGDLSVKVRNRRIGGDAGAFGSLSSTNGSQSLPGENVETPVFVGVDLVGAYLDKAVLS